MRTLVYRIKCDEEDVHHVVSNVDDVLSHAMCNPQITKTLDDKVYIVESYMTQDDRYIEKIFANHDDAKAFVIQKADDDDHYDEYVITERIVE